MYNIKIGVPQEMFLDLLVTTGEFEKEAENLFTCDIRLHACTFS